MNGNTVGVLNRAEGILPPLRFPGSRKWPGEAVTQREDHKRVSAGEGGRGALADGGTPNGGGPWWGGGGGRLPG